MSSKAYSPLKSPLTSARGISMMEVILASSISLMVLGGVVATLTVVNRSGTQFNLLQARNEIINKIRVQAMNPANLIASAKITDTLGHAGLPYDYGPPSTLANPELLHKCIPDIGGTETFGCDKTTLEEIGRGFKFYLAENGSLEPERTVAGEDVYYRNTGLRCSGAEAANPSLCPLEARTWFEPFCLNFASTCTKAMSLAVRYSIGIRSDFKDEKVAVPTVDGEFYIPLQRGIQIRNLLNQLNAVINPNSKGIFTIPKFYGHTGQTISGLRFETQISNPYGLVSMRIQMRSLTGPLAKQYEDTQIPDGILNREWTDVPTPGNSGLGPWAINLAGAIPNQVFNFGTQVTVAANSRSLSPYTPASFIVGSSAVPLNPTYRWTVNNEKTAYRPPAFQSGFYQFRVIATDVLGKEVESTNYITVRIISTPEFQFVDPQFSLKRDCVNTAQGYRVFVGDDEEISFSEVKISGQTVDSSSVAGGTDGLISFDFMKNLPPGNYPITVILKNRFSDIPLETLLMKKVESHSSVNLTDVTATTSPGITSNPEKIRVTHTGSVSLNYTTGNCCQAFPEVTWAYPNPAIFGGIPLLSGPNASTMSCIVTDNTRTCSTTITAKGEAESPPLSTSQANMSATLNLGDVGGETACNLPSGGTLVTKHIPVILVPTIAFVLPESAWLTIPGPSIKATSPTAYVRIDFSPDDTVDVQVANALNSSQIFCNLTFPGGTSLNPVTLPCSIPPNFNGDLVLQRPAGPVESQKIQLPNEAPDNKYKAKITDQFNHRVCQADITSLSDTPVTYTVPATLPMNDSPYGTTLDANGNVVQDSNNDTGHWVAGRNKTLRCYDQWGSYATDQYNKQDYYDLYSYNVTRTLNQRAHRSITKRTFSTYLVPHNPPLIVDITSVTIPYLYLVHQEGNPGTLVWNLDDSQSGASASTSQQSWQNVTSQFCGGSASLSKIQVYRTRLSVESTSGNIIMKAANAFTTFNMSGIYSYSFMCGYGRWHPSGKTSNNWID